jgi:hypothetical protein
MRALIFSYACVYRSVMEASWASRVSNWVSTVVNQLSRKSSPPKMDGRPTRKVADRRAAFIRNKRKSFAVLNPSAVELGHKFQDFSRRYPYGRCAVCKKHTHNTADHDAVIAFAKRKRAAKTAKNRAKGIAKAPKAAYIPPFICLDEGMRHAFDEETFDRTWKSVKGCINVVLSKMPGLFNVRTRVDGEEITESDGNPRVYRDDWYNQWKGMGCCPEEVENIAREMTQEFMTNGVTTRFAFVQGIEYLYYCICYAVIRVFLDMLEWEFMHMADQFEICMNDHRMRGVKANGEELAMFMVSDHLICDKMRLGKYLSRLVDAVRHEGEEGMEHDEDDGEEDVEE